MFIARIAETPTRDYPTDTPAKKNYEKLKRNENKNPIHLARL
jgi:hypothetical protein